MASLSAERGGGPRRHWSLKRGVGRVELVQVGLRVEGLLVRRPRWHQWARREVPAGIVGLYTTYPPLA